ncbi:type I polyketide synthase [Polyangium sorediatum]|uniref:Type I polyketide synthase n=1 Tax=Polyangium sorediatum TaxID=889274 RepID=A0ABT6NUB1_9BACT|nr:type I polyketide synthase [Polyangium sorediatum]MDI1431902.1 type I polyketide synthase [Polyangium sorediatum]
MSALLEEYRSRLREALSVINELKSRLDTAERASVEPIAIIGMSCRFPGGGGGPDRFFDSLLRGVDAVGEIPPERWPKEAIPGDRPEVRWAALLDDLSGFDAEFFGIAPREAQSLDPQQRLLLEGAWEALEDAGTRPDTLSGSKTGVFVGICASDNQHRVLIRGTDQFDMYCATGNAYSTAAGRISFVLGLQGPCMSIDTACSSSLVAVAEGCHSLRAGDSDLVIAAGVNVILSPLAMALLAGTQALSPDGRSRAFDARANGFVRGEGCGVLVMKRLSDAMRDGDRIQAVIRGWAVNQDGRSTGLTTPNVLSQKALLRRALERARLAPSDIGFVETHGTGTPLGDPIEMEALREVLGAPRPDGSTCVLGAVKTNIGHLEGAAGVAGIIKAVLAMRHECIPRNQHFRRLNPRISLDGTCFVLPTENVPWPHGDKPRRAGVSSFGISGTNAHVILEEPPPEATAERPRAEGAHWLVLSARSKTALPELAGAYAERLSTASDGELADITYTASVRRVHHEHRLVVTGRTRQELSEQLSAFARGEVSPSLSQGSTSPHGDPKVVMVFSGQGSQWAGMGQDLRGEVVFWKKLEECETILRRYVSWSLLEELAAPEALSRLGETEVVQPALFSLQVSLTELYASWGIVPGAVVGHSVGEIAAAHVSGALSLEEALRLAVYRGRTMQKATGFGKMMAVEIDRERAERVLSDYEQQLSIAAVNAPNSVVLSGEGAALDAVAARLEAEGVPCRSLRVNYAFHSPQIEPLKRELVQALGRIEAGPTRIPMFSTVTGARIDGRDLGADYWGDNMRQPVLLSRATQAAIEGGGGLLFEVSPHPVLTANLRQCVAAQGEKVDVVYTLKRQADGRRAALDALGALHVRGCSVHWGALHGGRGRSVSLPAYPWQRARHWLDVDFVASSLGDAGDAKAHVATPSPPERGARGPASFRATLAMALPGERRELVQVHVARQLGLVLGQDPHRIDPRAPFSSVGVDSLMGMELGKRLEATVEVSLPATFLFAYPTVEALAEHLLGQLDVMGPPATNPEPDISSFAPVAPPVEVAPLLSPKPAPTQEELTEGEVAVLLEAKLDALERWLGLGSQPLR